MATRGDALATSGVLREYYKEIDFFALENNLRAVSIVLYVSCGAALLGASACADSSLLVGADGMLGLAGAAAVLAVASYAALLLALPVRAPLLWLIVDIIVSTSTAVLLLVVTALRTALCGAGVGAGGGAGGGAMADYLCVPLAALNLCAVVGGAALTYRAVTARWDALRRRTDAARPRAAPPARDLDV